MWLSTDAEFRGVGLGPILGTQQRYAAEVEFTGEAVFSDSLSIYIRWRLNISQYWVGVMPVYFLKSLLK